jgi:hypothetical protein
MAAAILATKTSVMALVLLGGVVTGAVVAVASNGTLATLNYHITGVQPVQPEVLPINLSLGTLAPGSTGTVTGNATVNITSAGLYQVRLNHVEQLNSVFSEFVVVVNINGEAFTLTAGRGQDTATVYLTPASYKLEIRLTYQVSQSPFGELSVHNLAFLTIQPAGHLSTAPTPPTVSSHSRGHHDKDDNDSDN